MADLADQADAQNAAAFEAETRAKRQPEGPPPTGRCHNCDDPLADGHRWCDTLCRKDWATREEAKKRNGSA